MDKSVIISLSSNSTVAKVKRRLNYASVTVPLRRLSKSKTNSFKLFIIKINIKYRICFITIWAYIFFSTSLIATSYLLELLLSPFYLTKGFGSLRVMAKYLFNKYYSSVSSIASQNLT